MSGFLKHETVIKARIATYGEKAEDRFSITTKQDTPLIRKTDLDRLLKDLKSSLHGDLYEQIS